MTELLGEDTAFVIRHAERTYAELEEHADEVRALMLGPKAKGVFIVSVSTNVRRNRIDVGVHGRHRVAKRTLAPLGDVVHVERQQIPQLG